MIMIITTTIDSFCLLQYMIYYYQMLYIAAGRNGVIVAKLCVLLSVDCVLWRLGFEFFVEHKDSEPFADTASVGQQISDRLDGVHLFLQIFGFNEVAEGGISVAVGDTMQIQKALKHYHSANVIKLTEALTLV